MNYIDWLEDLGYIVEARIMKPDNIVGTMFYYKGGMSFLDQMGFGVGETFTIVNTEDKVDKRISDNDEYVKTLQASDGRKVTLSGGLGSYATYFNELKSGGLKPSGEDWESLIVVAYNNRFEGSEWERAEKFWANYGDLAKKVADSFKRIINDSSLSQFGSSTASLSSDWKGKNNTPKTDILGNSSRISLKKKGGSQLVSGGMAETLSTFEAVMKTMGDKAPKELIKFIDELEKKMGKLYYDGTITHIKNNLMKKDQDKLTVKEKDIIKQYEEMDLNHKELTKQLQTDIFTGDTFKTIFCFEAATGYTKFSDKKAVADTLVEFDPSGKITKHLPMKKYSDAKPLASKTKFIVGFKTAGSNPFSSFRAITKEHNISSFKQIVTEELKKSGFKSLILENNEQLNEFKMFSNLIGRIKNVSGEIKLKLKNVYNSIMTRIKKVLNKIKTLGSKMFDAICGFIGIQVQSINASGGGDFPINYLLGK